MFERYTEKARRTIFFARYEASQYGSPEITTEHLLLGLIREDTRTFEAIFKDFDQIRAIQEEVRARERLTAREKLSTQVDLPVSNPSKRVLAYAAEEAERLNDRHIGTEHLLLGLLREPDSTAADILTKHGADLAKIRERAHEISESASSRRAITYEERGVGGVERDVRVEFIDRATQTQIAVGAHPAAIPTIGEEVVFEEPGGLIRTFRVVDVTYVFRSAQPSPGAPRKRLARIIVALEMLEPGSSPDEPDLKPQ
jgi:ATP-dependent Clp protease ATP-binding subunit ClpC